MSHVLHTPKLVKLAARRKRHALSTLLDVNHVVDGQPLEDANFYWVATGMAADGELFVPSRKWLDAMRDSERGDALWTCIQIERAVRNADGEAPDIDAMRAAAAGMRRLGLGDTPLRRALANDAVTVTWLRSARCQHTDRARGQTMRQLWETFSHLVALPLAWWDCEDGVHPVVDSDAAALESGSAWGRSACLAADEAVLLASMCLDTATNIAACLLFDDTTTKGGENDG